MRTVVVEGIDINTCDRREELKKNVANNTTTLAIVSNGNEENDCYINMWLIIGEASRWRQQMMIIVDENMVDGKLDDDDVSVRHYSMHICCSAMAKDMISRQKTFDVVNGGICQNQARG